MPNEKSEFLGINERNYALDFLKSVLTVSIVFHHYQQVTGTIFEKGINYYGGWFSFGLVVEFFFLISGYLMHRYIRTIQDGKMTLKEWYIKRALRLLPMVAISAVAYEILVYYHNFLCTGYDCPINQTVDIFGTIITSLGLQAGGAFVSPGINVPTWYVSVLLTMYVVFYCVTVLAKKIGCSPSYFYIALVLLGCSINTFKIHLPFINDGTSRGYYAFFFGVLFADYINRNGVSKKLLRMCIGIVLFTYLIIVYQREMIEVNIAYFVSFILFPSILVFFVTPASKRIFHHRIWKLIGDISFNVYIWHTPMLVTMILVTHALGITPHYVQRKWMYIFCLLAYLVGAISFYGIEKPLYQRITKTKGSNNT